MAKLQVEARGDLIFVTQVLVAHLAVMEEPQRKGD
jgi:hypothetical protein